MTRNDKVFFLHFIVRTLMYITTQNKSNVVSLITGYEIGSKNCNFSSLFKNFIAYKFKIQPTATGWPGQVELLSEKLSQNWLLTFKQATLQFITDQDVDSLKEELDKTIKRRIQVLIERIEEKGNPYFNDCWAEEWQYLCALDFEWFKQLWSSEKLEIVQAIYRSVSSKKIFADKSNNLPTKELIELRKLFTA